MLFWFFYHHLGLKYLSLGSMTLGNTEIEYFSFLLNICKMKERLHPHFPTVSRLARESGEFSDVMETWWSSFENLSVSSLVFCIRKKRVHSWRQWKMGVFWENQEGSWECQRHNKTALEQQMEKSSGYNRCINLSQQSTAMFHILLV